MFAVLTFFVILVVSVAKVRSSELNFGFVKTDLETGHVQFIDEYGALHLKSGKVLKLADIYVPDSSEGENTRPFPQEVIDDAEGRDIFYNAIGEADRFGRLPAHVWFQTQTDAKDWMQERLIGDGLARVMPTNIGKRQTQGHCLQAHYLSLLMKAEQTAGLQFSGKLTPINANDKRLIGKYGQFVVVEGTIRDIYKTKRIMKLNFGFNWRTDFTILLSGDVKSLMESRLNASEDIEGHFATVRGFLVEEDGPMIKLDHLHQLELAN